MPSLQIRDLPADIYEALSLRARTENRSMAQQAVVELRRIPEVESHDRRRALLARLREILKTEGVKRVSVPPEQAVREDRER